MIFSSRRSFPLNLALQGSGAHGAFTWGVLDHLLEEGHIRPAAVSGTSAGAINAVLLASGWQQGGREGARATLQAFWDDITKLMDPLQASWFASLAFGPAAHMVSPYQTNPFDVNPLRDLLERKVDFARLRESPGLKLLIAATAVRDGSLRLFTNQDISVKAVLASACLPMLYQAVEIDDEPYWDGGYVANPPLVPLVEQSPVRDVLLIRINPKRRHDLPVSADDIRNRIGEIVFDQPLKRELAQLDAHRGSSLSLSSAKRRIARHRLHIIDGGVQLVDLDPDSKLIPLRETVTKTRELGREAARAWIERGSQDRRPGKAPDTAKVGWKPAPG